MPSRPHRRIYALQAEICRALANPTRLQILHLLGTREMSFGELRTAVGVSKANLSQHLAVLRKSKVVTDRREGLRAFYRLTYPEIDAACQAVGRVLAKHLAETGKQAEMLLREAVSVRS